MIQQFQKTCDVCNGSGINIKPHDKCPTCKGAGLTSTKVDVQIPLKRGVSEGQKIDPRGLKNAEPTKLASDSGGPGVPGERERGVQDPWLASIAWHSDLSSCSWWAWRSGR